MVCRNVYNLCHWMLSNIAIITIGCVGDRQEDFWVASVGKGLSDDFIRHCRKISGAGMDATPNPWKKAARDTKSPSQAQFARYVSPRTGDKESEVSCEQAYRLGGVGLGPTSQWEAVKQRHSLTLTTTIPTRDP